MPNWELGNYHGWGVSHQYSIDDLKAAVLVDGKHFHEFRGETSRMDAERMASEMANSKRNKAPLQNVTSSGHELFKDLLSDGVWYRQHPKDQETYTPMGTE